MREFILRAQKARTTPDFNLNDLPNAGRLDLVARCISNALFISNNLRNDTIIHAVLEGPKDPPKIISFYGSDLKDFYFDEKNIALLIQNALKKGLKLESNKEIEVHPGIKISRKSFEQLVKEKSRTVKLFYLHEKGQDIRNKELNENIIFIFGDFTGMPSKTEKFLDNQGAEKISLGPTTLFASHCIIIAHNELDRKQVHP